MVKFKSVIQSSNRILKRHAYALFMCKQIFVCMFMKNFVLIDQLKFMQLKFTPTSVNFSILFPVPFYFSKPVGLGNLSKIKLSKPQLLLVLWWSKIWHSFCSLNLNDVHEQDGMWTKISTILFKESLYCK